MIKKDKKTRREQEEQYISESNHFSFATNKESICLGGLSISSNTLGFKKLLDYALLLLKEPDVQRLLGFDEKCKVEYT